MGFVVPRADDVIVYHNNNDHHKSSECCTSDISAGYNIILLLFINCQWSGFCIVRLLVRTITLIFGDCMASPGGI